MECLDRRISRVVLGGILARVVGCIVYVGVVVGFLVFGGIRWFSAGCVGVVRLVGIS